LTASAAPKRSDTEIAFGVTGMDCASCAQTIEHGVASLPGVNAASVSFATATLTVEGDVTADTLRKRVAQLGYGLSDAKDAASNIGRRASDSRHTFFHFLLANRTTRLALLMAAIAMATTALLAAGANAATDRIADAVYAIVVAVVGLPIALKGWRALIFARRITIDLLMSIAAVGALAIGATGEAVTVVLLFALGEALEAYSAAKSRDSIASLLDLQPATATVIVKHGRDHDSSHEHDHHDRYEQEHEHLQLRPVSALMPGDRVLVKPGECIPADGLIVEGSSSVDESAVTGEPLPVARGAGDDVHAGTINGEGTLEIAVSTAPEEFLIARIAGLVAHAQASRSPAERYIDRFARWYTPAVVVLATAVACIPPLFFGQSFLGSETAADGWLYRGLALLIVACPCALILSVPVTVVSALARLAQLGILVRGGAELDRLAQTKTYAFDKTGTLTRGRPVVSGLRARDCTHVTTALEQCAPCDELVAVAAAVESGASHPLAVAVLHEARTRAGSLTQERATGITNHAGRGISGTVAGSRITVGHAELANGKRGLDALMAARTDAPNSVMVVSRDDEAVGIIEVADTLRPEARAALARLKKLNPDARFVMLTGDRQRAAETVAAQLGIIDEIHADLLPEQKLNLIHALEAAHGNVAMIGDGINDAPALAAAGIGIAMGGTATEQAMQTAQVVLMHDDLNGIAQSVGIARNTRRRITENIALSLAFKIAFIFLAIPGLATLWMAVAADVGATILVTLNGLRMLRDSGGTLR
jgi:Cd2+/Zn2+-exporting ATPase